MENYTTPLKLIEIKKDRGFDQANSGLVVESFLLPDIEAVHAILIVASDASFQGHNGPTSTLL